MKNLSVFFLVITLFAFSVCVKRVVLAQSDTKSKLAITIEEKTTDMEKFPGYFTFYYDEKEDKIWLEIDKWNSEFLYLAYVTHGIGSINLGMERGSGWGSQILKFQRHGSKVLLVQPNYSFQALSGNEEERLIVEESFAKSVIWGFKVEAEDNGSVLVDASKFFQRDVYGVIEWLKSQDHGIYKLESDRCGFYSPRTKNFPRNTDVEVILTYTSDAPGAVVGEVVPSPGAITMQMHHSFVMLPDDRYKTRKFDPRAGFFRWSLMDFSAALDEPILKRSIIRHRLEKKNPEALISEPVEPIIYYVDRGVPEPILTAIIEGAQWWNQAFEAAGYRNAFKVEVLPDSIDPMDIRYNRIQWVHRSTRGGAYGGGIFDPRTGEIIRGLCTIGSLRIRHNILLAAGLLAPYEEGKPVPDTIQEFALARMRQLAAHEVGHSLGLRHNFAASVSNRASVMDYTYPLVKFKEDGSLDLSKAYDTDIGEWDKIAITYGYQDFPEETNEEKALNAIINKASSQGLHFISDEDAWPEGGAHPLAHLWDNGSNAIDELDHIMRVREHVLNRISEKNIREGTPMATIEDVLVPMYMFHSYQLNAVAKWLGGMYYNYAVRGDGQKLTEIVSTNEQRRALEALLKTINPKALALPERILQTIPPRPIGYSRSHENFKTRTGPTIDPLTVAESAANLTIKLILHPERAARLIEFHARDKKYPGLIEVIDKLITYTWKSTHKLDYHSEIQRVVDNLVLHNLLTLATNENVSGQVRAIAYLKLDELKTWLTKQKENEKEINQKAHYLFAISQINQFQENPNLIKIYEPVEPPPGPPYGCMNSNLFY